MNPRTRRALHGVANGGLALAVLLALVPMGMRAYGSWTQAVARRGLAPSIRAASLRVAARSGSARAALRKPILTPPRRGFETCLLQIPAIGVEAVVDEGRGDWHLLPGPGHEPGTPGAGGAGNCVIAAHRNMWGQTFADLPNLRPGDEVVVTDSRGIYTYQVDVSHEISTRERGRLGRTRDARLTLYTCVEPFQADRRWLVQARLVDRYTQK